MAFDVITPKKIVNAELSLLNQLLYTVPSNTRLFLKDINIANNNTSAADIILYTIDLGGTAGNDNILLPTINILANEVLQWTGSQILEAGDRIEGFASVSDVCIKISGGLAV